MPGPTPSYQCGICASDRQAVINSFLAAGRAPFWIEKQMRELNSPTKAETVKRHLMRCLNGNPDNAALLEGAASGKKISDNADFAAAVRSEANRLLAEGKLNISTAHGLQAQQIIDRRAEKAADRKLMVELAGLLSGSRAAIGPPEDLIEGEWEEVEKTDETLAPLALVAGE